MINRENAASPNGAINDVQKDPEQAEQIIQGGDNVGGDKVEGDKVTTGAIDGPVAIGDGAQANINNYFGKQLAEPPSVATLEQFIMNSVIADPVEEGEDDDSIQLWDYVPIRFHIPGDLDKKVPPEDDLFVAVQGILKRDEATGRLNRLKILADSGGGKTAALNYLQKKQAEKSLKEAEEGGFDEVTIPLFISLSYLQAGIPFRALIRDAFNRLLEPGVGDENVAEISVDQVELMLGQRYRFLFLLDGLEDLLTVPASRGLQFLTSFMVANPKHYYVLSSNTTANRKQFGESEDIIILDDLEEEDVEAILDQGKIGRLNPALKSLLRNRALLKIALNLLEKEASVEHIRSKGQLLRELSRQRLGYEDFNWESKAPNPDMLELLLEELAFAMLRNHADTFKEYEMMRFIHDYIQEWNEPYSWRQIADFLEKDAGILKRDDLRQWSFRHKSTKAYFAAAALLKQPERVDDVLDDLQGTWWHDALAILIGLQVEPTELCYKLIDHDVYVAAYCVRFSGRDVDNRVFDALVDTLIEKMSRENSNRRSQIVLQIGESGHPRAIDALLVALQRDWSSSVIEAVVRAIALWTEHQDSGLEQLRGELRAKVADSAVSSMVELCVGQLLGIGNGKFDLADVRATIEDPQAGRLAQGLAALALGFQQEEACRGELIFMMHHPHPKEFVTWCGIEALTLYADDEEVVNAAKEILGQQGENGAEYGSPCRKLAAYLLGWVNSNPETSDILWQALRDENQDPDVIIYAIDAVVRLHLIGVQKELESMLENETRPAIERKIVESLGDIGDLGSIEVLERFLLRESAQTRRLAKRAIEEINNRHEVEAGYEYKREAE